MRKLLLLTVLSFATFALAGQTLLGSYTGSANDPDGGAVGLSVPNQPLGFTVTVGDTQNDGGTKPIGFTERAWCYSASTSKWVRIPSLDIAASTDAGYSNLQWSTASYTPAECSRVYFQSISPVTVHSVRVNESY